MSSIDHLDSHPKPWFSDRQNDIKSNGRKTIKIITNFCAYVLWSNDLDFNVIQCKFRRLRLLYFCQPNYTYIVRLLESPVTVNYWPIGNCTIVIRYSPVLPDVALETNTKGQRLAMDTNHTECISSSFTGCCVFVYVCICVYMCVHVSEYYISSYLLFAQADTQFYSHAAPQFRTRLKAKNGIERLNTVKFLHPLKQTKGTEIISMLKRCDLQFILA